MAAGAERRVDVDAAVTGSEVGDDLAQQHGDMARRHVGHRRLAGVAVRHGCKAGEWGAWTRRRSRSGAFDTGPVRARRERGRGTAMPLSIMANPMQPKEKWIGWR